MKQRGQHHVDAVLSSTLPRRIHQARFYKRVGYSSSKCQALRPPSARYPSTVHTGQAPSARHRPSPREDTYTASAASSPSYASWPGHPHSSPVYSIATFRLHFKGKRLYRHSIYGVMVRKNNHFLTIWPVIKGVRISIAFLQNQLYERGGSDPFRKGIHPTYGPNIKSRGIPPSGETLLR